jgi:hypothetical protein
VLESKRFLGEKKLGIKARNEWESDRLERRALSSTTHDHDAMDIPVY